MNAEQILKAMRAQRELCVPMGGADDAPKRMTLLRPTDLEVQRDMIKLMPGDGGKPTAQLLLDTDTVHRFVVAWDGYTTADLLGPAGGSDAAPFSPDLVREWLATHPEDIRKLVDALMGAITEHINTRAEAAKN